MDRFAVAVLVGPKDRELERLADLVASVEGWEPRPSYWVLIDDGVGERHLDRCIKLRAGSEVVCLRYPRDQHHAPTPLLGAGTLLALAHVQVQTRAPFMLKLDTDALAIAPFADAIERYIASTADVGVVGTIGDTCDPTRRNLRKLHKEPQLAQFHRLVPPDVLETHRDAPFEIPGVGTATPEALRAFADVRPHIARAIAGGYTRLEYCQGGAYAVTRAFMNRMAEAGYFDTLRSWNLIPSGEDVIVGMYARAIGLRLADCSGPGEPFGVQSDGLAYDPEELIERGYSLIHSVKGDPARPEAAVRAYFAERRPAPSARVTLALSAGPITGRITGPITAS